MTGKCCPLPGSNCFLRPVVYLFRRETQSRDRCNPVFGLQDSIINYLGCFNGIFKSFPSESDRLILKGNPPLGATDAWIVPGSSNSGYVIKRSWRMGAVSYFQIDDEKKPVFNLSILSKAAPDLRDRIGVPINEQLVFCGDRK